MLCRRTWTQMNSKDIFTHNIKSTNACTVQLHCLYEVDYQCHLDKLTHHSTEVNLSLGAGTYICSYIVYTVN